MLLKDIDHVQALDSAITKLHQELATLYMQRSRLLTDHPQSISNLDFEDLINAWQRYNLTVPLSLKKKYQRAVASMQKLEKANIAPAGHLKVVAVPPTKQLDQAIQMVMSQGSSRFDCAKADIYTKSKQRMSWSVLIVFPLSQRVAVTDLNAFLANKAYLFAGHDIRGLGPQELVAAELQGLPTVMVNEWALLLNDSTLPLCATNHTSQIKLEIEDADCLLGSNYIQPAIVIR